MKDKHCSIRQSFAIVGLLAMASIQATHAQTPTPIVPPNAVPSSSVLPACTTAESLIFCGSSVTYPPGYFLPDQDLNSFLTALGEAPLWCGGYYTGGTSCNPAPYSLRAYATSSTITVVLVPENVTFSQASVFSAYLVKPTATGALVNVLGQSCTPQLQGSIVMLCTIRPTAAGSYIVVSSPQGTTAEQFKSEYVEITFTP